MNTPTLFYSPSCEYCHIVLDALVPVFAERGVPLYIRMPTLTEKLTVERVPALFLPEGTFDLKKPHLLFGGGIPQWLRTITDGTTNSND